MRQSSLIAAATGSEKASGEGAGKALVLDVYQTIGLWAVGFGILVIVVSPLIKKLMHLDSLRDAEDLAGQKELAEPQAAGVHPEPKGA